MLNDKGQTGIEYILLLVVMMTIIISLMSRVRERLIGSVFPCPNDDQSLGCVITRSVSTFGSGPRFRFFRLRK
jgi:hypothetical protein